MKVLCFTTSYNRPYYIYNTINNILNQSYTNINYSVNINTNHQDDINLYTQLLKDFQQDDRLKIIYNTNLDQHTNYLRAIKGFNNTDYDLFCKIDDDDIYHKNYITKSIEYFKTHKCDILSYIPQHHINNGKIKGSIESIGKWQPDINSPIKFGMPPTYIFNKKACNIIMNISSQQSRSIHFFEDGSWREYWRKYKLISHVIDNDNVFVYNIHKDNVSSKYLLDNQINTNIIENEFFSLIYVHSPKWKSYVYLNKRNQRLYNINNNDHGSFTIQNNKLTIKWDDWGTEIFEKNKDNIYVLVK